MVERDEAGEWLSRTGSEPMPSVDLRTDRAHPARVYDYMLGGKTNFPVDREVGDRILAEWPGSRTATRASRAVMHRMTRRLAETHGIRQFLDIGTGIPTTPNLHEVAQSVDPTCRVVYVDNDPIVLAHSRALLTSAPEGRTAYVEGDFREPERFLADPAVTGTLDFTRPIAVMLVNLVHFLSDEAAHPPVRKILDALPSGSYLALAAGTADSIPELVSVGSRRYSEAGIENHLRPRAAVERFFDGLELDEPGVALVNRWYPELDDEPALADHDVASYAGLARKP
ncbi:SAM-dependent methyltransferase [Streptomyces kaniharaensis]|uniref:SAM-dependent methyltransferase n=1 Tax=Streptomyces kaniharaensis TaxID=212423 RepID=A0A6N7KZ72_9ACTN|nr:SAM-dependent methyltransferase [Streptomyces kaniharaensis]MQS16942.1 SAM-dependent methyltransferase [Streptomyces kaniharaensis]